MTSTVTSLVKMENEGMICRLMEGEAEDYIKLHKIMELFKNMTALLLYHRPGNMGNRFPTKFQVSRVSRLVSDENQECQIRNFHATFRFLQHQEQQFTR